MASKLFYHGILLRNYRKMTIKWSFSYNSFVKLSVDLIEWPTRMDPKYSLRKGLHCEYRKTVTKSQIVAGVDRTNSPN